jgi:DNA-binding transcriptional ArsR family regulator
MSSFCSDFLMPRNSHVLSDDALTLVAKRFAILSEPMRLRLLQILMGGERHVNALAEAAGGTQANVSRHLQTLADAGMVSRRKEGLQVFYSIADPSIFQLCDLVCTSLEKQMAKQANVFRTPAKAGKSSS